MFVFVCVCACETISSAVELSKGGDADVFWRKKEQTNKQNGAQFFFLATLTMKDPSHLCSCEVGGVGHGARDFFGLKSGGGVEKHQVGIE